MFGRRKCFTSNTCDANVAGQAQVYPQQHTHPPSDRISSHQHCTHRRTATTTTGGPAATGIHTAVRATCAPPLHRQLPYQHACMPPAGIPPVYPQAYLHTASDRNRVSGHRVCRWCVCAAAAGTPLRCPRCCHHYAAGHPALLAMTHPTGTRAGEWLYRRWRGR